MAYDAAMADRLRVRNTWRLAAAGLMVAAATACGEGVRATVTPTPLPCPPVDPRGGDSGGWVQMDLNRPFVMPLSEIDPGNPENQASITVTGIVPNEGLEVMVDYPGKDPEAFYIPNNLDMGVRLSPDVGLGINLYACAAAAYLRLVILGPAEQAP